MVRHIIHIILQINLNNKYSFSTGTWANRLSVFGMEYILFESVRVR